MTIAVSHRGTVGGRLAHVAVMIALAVVAAVVAVSGSFMHRWMSPAGLMLAVGAAAGVCVLARRFSRSRLGIGGIGLTWLVPVLILAQPRPAGDIIIAGDPAGLVFLFGGVIAVAVTIGLGADRSR